MITKFKTLELLERNDSLLIFHSREIKEIFDYINDDAEINFLDGESHSLLYHILLKYNSDMRLYELMKLLKTKGFDFNQDKNSLLKRLINASKPVMDVADILHRNFKSLEFLMIEFSTDYCLMTFLLDIFRLGYLERDITKEVELFKMVMSRYDNLKSIKLPLSKIYGVLNRYDFESEEVLDIYFKILNIFLDNGLDIDLKELEKLDNYPLDVLEQKFSDTKLYNEYNKSIKVKDFNL